MRLSPPRHLSTLIALLALTALAGCKKETPAPSSATAEVELPAKAESLVVYSGRNEALVGPLLKRFEEETGIKLELRYANTAQLAATILEEGANSPADVFYAQDVSTLGLLEERGRLAPLPQEVLGKVTGTTRSPEGKWIGISGRARVLVYNTDKVAADEVPSIEELTTPAWKGRVAWAPENASFQSFLVAMIEKEGVEKTRAWLEAMKKNEPRAFPSNVPLVAAVAKGEIDVGLANHYYLYRIRGEQGEGVKAENHYYRNGKAESFVSVSGAGILDTSKKAATAQKLIEFLLTPESQRYLAQANFEFPAVEGIETPHSLPPVSSLQRPDVSAGSLANLERAVTLLRETGILL